MKYLLSITILVFAASAGSIAQNCTSPVDDATFNRLIQDYRLNYPGQRQAPNAHRLINSYCLTSSQVKTVADLFVTDDSRLLFCIEAYNHVYDPENYYDVYDSFVTFSMAFRLHDIIYGLISLPTDVPYPTEEIPVELTFPNLNYPSPINYNGVIGCASPVNNQLFIDISYRLMEEPTDDGKLDYMAGKSQVDCFTMAQAMKFGTLFDNEIASLIMLKEVFVNLYDMENYKAAGVLFSNPANTNDWLSYANAVLSDTLIPTEIVEEPVCETTQDELSEMNTALEKQNFPSDKLDMVRLLVKDHCFTVNQIKGLMVQINFGHDRLELAKIAYDSCTDTQNYYQLIDQLTFSSEKEELREFIQSKGN